MGSMLLSRCAGVGGYVKGMLGWVCGRVQSGLQRNSSPSNKLVVLCCVVLSCAVMCCAVSCGIVLCGVVLRCDVI